MARFVFFPKSEPAYRNPERRLNHGRNYHSDCGTGGNSRWLFLVVKEPIIQGIVRNSNYPES